MAVSRLEKGKKLLDWYVENQRDLPWRHTRDPYKIWISEIMLQQTRVDTVIEYYNRFTQRFPDIGTLAEAEEGEVLNYWKGLGYYTRARNLHKAAQQMAKEHGGVFPRDIEEVRKLPGVGAYTAGAVLSIAFNEPYPAVDGNVLRVISRLEGLEEDIARETTKKTVAGVVSQMIPEGEARDFNQALMELGALICIPGIPKCGQCPVQSMCTAFLTGRQEELPVRRKKENLLPEIPYWVALVEDEDRILLEYREKETLLGRLWGFPMVEKKGEEKPEMLFEKKYGLKLQPREELGTVQHVFSHRIWVMDTLRCTALSVSEEASALQWVHREQLKDFAIPTAFQRALKLGFK